MEFRNHHSGYKRIENEISTKIVIENYKFCFAKIWPSEVSLVYIDL